MIGFVEIQALLAGPQPNAVNNSFRVTARVRDQIQFAVPCNVGEHEVCGVPATVEVPTQKKRSVTAPGEHVQTFLMVSTTNDEVQGAVAIEIGHSDHRQSQGM